MKLKKIKSFKRSLAEQWKIYKNIKENGLISCKFIKFHWLVRYKGTYDVVRIIVEGKLLTTILFKKYASSKCIKIIGILGNEEDYKTLEVLQEIKSQMISYEALGYDRIFIELPLRKTTIIKLFLEELDFYEDVKGNLKYLLETRRNNYLILHKSLIQ